ncbi:RNA-binding protein [Entamoeba marina]
MSQNQKKREADRTLFIQNLSFSTTEDKLKDKFGQFGDLCYCKICIDKQTGLSKGSAFCFRESDIEVDGRKLILSKTIPREEAEKNKQKKKKLKDSIKDNRNVSLANIGSKTKEEYEEMGLKGEEIKLRLRAQMERNKKLKNVNYCINKYRICLRNLPKDVKEKDIRKELDKHCKHGKISDIKLTKGDKGKNKGYGFVQFTEHEDALNIKFEKEKKEQFKANKVENKGKSVRVTTLPKQVIEKEDSTKSYKKSKHPKKLPQKVALAKRFNTKKSAF